MPTNRLTPVKALRHPGVRKDTVNNRLADPAVYPGLMSRYVGPVRAIMAPLKLMDFTGLVIHEN